MPATSPNDPRSPGATPAQQTNSSFDGTLEQQQQLLDILKTLFEHTPEAIGISGIDGRITYANSAYRTLLGYGDETIGVDWRVFYPPESLARLDAISQEILAHGFWRGVLEQQDRDGRRFPAQITAILLRDAEGNPYAYAAVIRDISEEQQREAELHMFKNLVERAPDGIVIADMQGYYTYANTAMHALSGTNDLIGAFGPDLAAEEPEIVQTNFQQLIEQGVVRVTTRLRRSDGSVIPVGTVTYWLDGPNGSNVIISFVRDLTEEQRRERERQELQEQVIRAQQAALRELSTPLIPIAEGVVVMPLIGSVDT
ncbi:MAG: PAS domain S-box protein [Chloroflexaceae bacterium]